MFSPREVFHSTESHSSSDRTQLFSGPTGRSDTRAGVKVVFQIGTPVTIIDTPIDPSLRAAQRSYW